MPAFESDTDFSSLLDKAKRITGGKKEGWVLYIENPHGEERLIKLKTDDYARLRSGSGEISPNRVIENIIRETFDGFMLKVPPAFVDYVVDIAEKIYEQEIDLDHKVDQWFSIVSDNTKNRFEYMKYTKEHIPKEFQDYVRAKYNGEPYNVLMRGKKGTKGYHPKTMGELGITI